jgi:hypothetical protein
MPSLKLKCKSAELVQNKKEMNKERGTRTWIFTTQFYFLLFVWTYTTVFFLEIWHKQVSRQYIRA